MLTIIEIGLISFITSFSGFFLGYLISLINKKNTIKQTGFILGLTGGVLISIICFELLPQGINLFGVSIPIISMTVALLFSAYFQHTLSNLKENLEQLKIIKLSLLSVVLLGIDNFPEGFALGSVLYHSHLRELHMLFTLFLHCILDSLIIFMPSKYTKYKNVSSFKFIIITSIIISLSALFGAFLTSLSYFVLPISIGSVSGIILYMTLGELIPKSRTVWNGRFATLGACIGVIIGILLISIEV